MQRKELIETITKEVLKKLDNSKIEEKESKKKKILLTEKIDLNLSSKIKEKYEICYFSEKNSDINLTEINEIIITKLDMKLLIELAELMQFKPESELILTSLLKGKNVYVLTQAVKYYQYKKTSPNTLYNKLMEAENKLKSFGIEFLTLEEIEKNLISKKYHSIKDDNHLISKQKQEYFSLDKKLVDYSIIKDIHEKDYDKVEIYANSIITDLARDYIEDKNIELKERR